MAKLIFSSSAIGIFYSVMNMLLIPRLTFEMQSSSYAGLMMSFAMIVCLFATPVIGFLCDRNNIAKKIIMVMFLFGAVSLLLLSFAFGTVCVVSALVLVIVSYVILTPYSALVGSLSSGKFKDRNFGYVMGTVNLSVFFVSLLMERMNDLKSVYLIFSTVVFLMVIPVYKTESGVKAHGSDLSEKNELKHFFSGNEYKKLVPFFTMQFFSWFVIGGVMPYLTTFLSAETGMTLGTASFWVGLSTLVSSLASFSCGLMCRIIGQKTLLAGSLAIAAALLSSMVFFYEIIITSGLITGMLFLILGSVCAGFFYSLGVSILSRITDRKNQGRIFGLNSFFMIASQAISVAVSGRIVENHGFKNYWELMLASALASFFAVMIFCLFEKGEIQKE